MPGSKVALVSHVLPPSWSGQAMALQRIYSGAEPDRYYLISRQRYAVDDQRLEEALRLPAKYYHLPSEPQLPTGQRFGVGRLTAAINPWIQTFSRARTITTILRRENCDAVVACSGDLSDPPAAYLASRRADIPFYLHAFDDYSFQWVARRMRAYAQRAERIIMRGAAGVIVPNEFLGEEYAQRYGIEPTLVHNPSHATGEEEKPAASWPSRAGEIRIVYTGAVYHAHHDAFRNLIAALELLGRSAIRVHIYTAQSPDELEKENIRGPVTVDEHLTQSQTRAAQRQADILFLPLAFDSPIQEVVRTSAPGKMGEYLASGKPVLVHAPAGSFVSWYFREHGCGVVVDENRPEALLEGIRSIIKDQSLRKRMVEKAWLASKRDFSLPAVRTAYWGLFDTV
jgi:glycosyltransferase involved in cell wall biosynthesis